MQGSPVRSVHGSACLLAAAALALFAAFAPAPAESAPSGALSMNPSNNAIDVGDTVSITFDISGGVDVHAVHLGVTYNASVVQVVDADAAASGTQVLPGPFPGTDTEGAVLQNSVSGGIINYQYELDNADEVSGGGTLATVQFVALASGNANLSWSTRQLRDGNDVTSTPSASAAVLVVGNTEPIPTDTPEPAATDTPAATATHTAAATGTATATRTVTATPTITATGTPAATNTPAPTSTARITILQNSNLGTATPQSGSVGVDPSQPERANGLPSAGTEGPGIVWWKWTFFAAALMLAAAGWFFTFALHYADRDVVLMDRFDARRKGLTGRKLPRR